MLRPSLSLPFLFSLLIANVSVSAKDASGVCPPAIQLTIGSYTGFQTDLPFNGTGITFVRFSTQGAIPYANLLPALSGHNPAYLARAGQYLYAVNEKKVGHLTQILFRPKMPFLSNRRVSSGGSYPTHLTIVKNPNVNQFVRWLIVTANYGAGSIGVAIKSSNLIYNVDTFTIPSDLASVHRNPALAERQSASHPHMVLAYNNSNNIVVPDLGTDHVFFFAINRERGKLTLLAKEKLMDGDGPRHAANHVTSNAVFVVSELTPSIAVLKPGCNGNMYLGLCKRIELFDQNDPMAENSSPAAIRTTRNGRFVYVSMRYTDGREGQIIAYRVNPVDGSFEKKIGTFPSGGVHPRDFIIIEQAKMSGTCKSFLAIVNRDSHNLVIIGRSFANGKLLTDEKRYVANINSPVSVF